MTMNAKRVTKGKSGLKIIVNGEQRTGDGKLVTRLFSIQAPEPPACISLKCLARFVYDSIFLVYLASYHRRRVEYCQTKKYAVDQVRDHAFLIRRSGFKPDGKTLYSYESKTYVTKIEAQKACDKIADTVLERYRTGEPSPKNLWQAIHANMKIVCPVCRKYNVDPLLFGGKK